MNRFDEAFFRRYIAEDDIMYQVCHRHPVLLVNMLLIWLFFGVFIGTFSYANNLFYIQMLLPLAYFKLFLGGIYGLLLYRIFDWYNDVWILTQDSIIDIDWTLFTTRVSRVEYSSIEGVEIIENSLLDKLLRKGDVSVKTSSEDMEVVLLGASAPHEVGENLQEIIQNLHAGEEETVEKTPFETLVETLQDVIKEHLERKNEWSQKAEEAPAEADDPLLKNALKKRGTIDLRPKLPETTNDDENLTKWLEE